MPGALPWSAPSPARGAARSNGAGGHEQHAQPQALYQNRNIGTCTSTSTLKTRHLHCRACMSQRARQLPTMPRTGRMPARRRTTRCGEPPWLPSTPCSAPRGSRVPVRTTTARRLRVGEACAGGGGAVECASVSAWAPCARLSLVRFMPGSDGFQAAMGSVLLACSLLATIVPWLLCAAGRGPAPPPKVEPAAAAALARRAASRLAARDLQRWALHMLQLRDAPWLRFVRFGHASVAGGLIELVAPRSRALLRSPLGSPRAGCRGRARRRGLDRGVWKAEPVFVGRVLRRVQATSVAAPAALVTRESASAARIHCDSAQCVQSYSGIRCVELAMHRFICARGKSH